jgi:hypothetical protein
MITQVIDFTKLDTQKVSCLEWRDCLGDCRRNPTVYRFHETVCAGLITPHELTLNHPFDISKTLEGSKNHAFIASSFSSSVNVVKDLTRLWRRQTNDKYATYSSMQLSPANEKGVHSITVYTIYRKTLLEAWSNDIFLIEANSPALSNYSHDRPLQRTSKWRQNKLIKFRCPKHEKQFV